MMLDYTALIALAIDMHWPPLAFSSLAIFAIAASEPAMFTADWLFFWINQFTPQRRFSYHRYAGSMRIGDVIWVMMFLYVVVTYLIETPSTEYGAMKRAKAKRIGIAYLVMVILAKASVIIWYFSTRSDAVA
jgi:hypothetical protein